MRGNAVRIHYRDWGGSGTTLLFAHATGFLGAQWLPLVHRIRGAGFQGRILTYDFRGHGLSSKPDSGYEWDSFVEDTRSLLQALDLNDVVGVGHSAGATTLARTAAKEPGRFRRLVLVDPILFGQAGVVERDGDNTMAARTRTRRLVWASREEIFESYRSRPPYDTWTEEALHAYVDHGTFDRPDGEVELLCPGRIEAQVYENAAAFDPYPLLAELALPTLVVRGELSQSFVGVLVERAMAALPAGRLVTIAGASHYVPMELPDEVTRLVLAELDA